MQHVEKMTVITAECYSGHKADERSVSFTLDGHKRIVEQILDRWRGPKFEFFKVLADDGKGYILKCNRKGEWAMERTFQP
jgi:hypothetical protein